jgi:hypothetical protein
MELFFASYLFTSSILFEVAELIADFFRVKAEPNADAHKRIQRMLIITEEPLRRLQGAGPLLMRRAGELFLKAEQRIFENGIHQSCLRAHISEADPSIEKLVRKRVYIGSAVMQAVPSSRFEPATFCGDWDTFGIHIVLRWLLFQRGSDYGVPRVRIHLADTTLKTHTQKFLRLDGKFHRQLAKHLFTKTVDDESDSVFRRNAALPAVEELILTDPLCRGLMLHL